MFATLAIFHWGVERRRGARAAERCRRTPGGEVLAASITPAVGPAVSMTPLGTFANLSCVGPRDALSRRFGRHWRMKQPSVPRAERMARDRSGRCSRRADG